MKMYPNKDIQLQTEHMYSKLSCVLINIAQISSIQFGYATIFLHLIFYKYVFNSVQTSPILATIIDTGNFYCLLIIQYLTIDTKIFPINQTLWIIWTYNIT